MPPTAPDPEVLAQWLQSARSDLLYSEIAPPEGAMYEQPSFHAQQAVEKALKALLLFLEEEPPYAHDLHALLQLLRARVDVPERLGEVELLVLAHNRLPTLAGLELRLPGRLRRLVPARESRRNTAVKGSVEEHIALVERPGEGGE